MMFLWCVFIVGFLCQQAQTASVYIPLSSSISDTCLVNTKNSDTCLVDISNRNNTTRVVIDGFIFYNEIDMLLFRLKEMNDLIDFFVLVESNITFSGSSKPLHYQENKHLFSEYNNKIIHVVVDDTHLFITPETSSPIWSREYHQRNGIANGIEVFNGLRYDDVILVSDVDEIVSRANVFELKYNDVYVSTGMFRFNMGFYYYNLNCKLRELWVYPLTVHYWMYESIIDSGLSVQDMRVNHSLVLGFADSGWHFSYFGSVDYIINKINTFSHQEFNKESIKDPKHLNELINSNQDILLRSDKVGSDGKFCDAFEIDETNLPLNYRMLQAFTMESSVEPTDGTIEEIPKTTTQLAVEREVNRILVLYNYTYSFDYRPMVYHESETESESDRTSILIADEVILKEIAMEAKYFLDAPDATADNIAPSIISLRKCRVVHIRIALETIQLILDNDTTARSSIQIQLQLRILSHRAGIGGR